ncbi:MAG: hypothetical protein IPN13_04100 [Bacteroidetes bacterium]|nr:hypothetical protein [Bacteroidota bacterium]
MKHGSKTHGASNSSFVSGPVKKVGNSSFIFPIGIGGTYRSLGMSAPSNSSNAYTAEYFNILQTFGSTLDSTIQEISNCDYWSFVNNSGTSPVNLIKLGLCFLLAI